MATHKCNKEREIGMILQELKDFKEDWKEMKTEIKENSLFRNQSKTIIGLVAFIATAFGGLVMWIADKLWLK